MPYAIDNKLVVGIASSALFDLTTSDAVFQDRGPEEYRRFQREHESDILEPGVAFPFIKRLCSLNDHHNDSPVEVILLSRNDADTGLRVMKSIEAHGLGIYRGVFLGGGDPYLYIPAFDCSLFLSANAKDVKESIMSGSPAGMVMDSDYVDDPDDHELRIAFDFDGVLAGDESERDYQQTGDLGAYHESERANAEVPLRPGPLKELLEKVA